MHIIMYCVTLLSTICVLVIEAGGSFVMGLLVFYLAAGFFSVYFTAGFMELFWERKDIYLWAGMGRAVNNLCAIFITFFSVWMLESGNAIGMIVTALLLFVLISMTMYGFLMEKNKAALRSEGIGREKGEQVAEQLAFSRAALYRHISKLNEKTNTKGRVGLLQFYHQWEMER